jgi:predicted GNAT family acetyltransferase
MAELLIKKEDGFQSGRYVARIEGVSGEAKLHYTKRGANVVSADHTIAAESLRGTGAARALVEYMVDDARTNGFSIVALCPYVRAELAKHPDWSDVMRAPAD